MEFDHEFTVPVPVERAWPVLLDAEHLTASVPGAVPGSGEDSARLKVRLGTTTITYRGTARIAAADAGTRTVTIEATGREARGSGTASVTVQIRLHEAGDATRVVLHAKLNVTGRPTQLDREVLTDSAARLLGRFAKALATALESAPRPAPTPIRGVVDPAAEKPGEPAPRDVLDQNVTDRTAGPPAEDHRSSDRPSGQDSLGQQPAAQGLAAAPEPTAEQRETPAAAAEPPHGANQPAGPEDRPATDQPPTTPGPSPEPRAAADQPPEPADRTAADQPPAPADRAPEPRNTEVPPTEPESHAADRPPATADRAPEPRHAKAPPTEPESRTADRPPAAEPRDVVDQQRAAAEPPAEPAAQNAADRGTSTARQPIDPEPQGVVDQQGAAEAALTARDAEDGEEPAEKVSAVAKRTAPLVAGVAALLTVRYLFRRRRGRHHR
ncbi:SRPBCC domain-containing protein [Actinomadura craniellae]|nr:SRPBCC domain-containing protein [Actinomadura craniellae]